MLSFNHYAYGAVIDWVYRNVAGLAPDPRGARATARSSSPRSRHAAIGWARATIESAIGEVPWRGGWVRTTA